MKVQTIVRTSGRVIEKGLLLKGDVKLIDVLQSISELDEVIRDINYGRTLVAHEDANIFADRLLSDIIPEFDEYDFSPLDEDEKPFQIVDKYADDGYDYKLMLGLFRNKANGL